jgi:hypothetical protein
MSREKSLEKAPQASGRPGDGILFNLYILQLDVAVRIIMAKANV